MSHDLFILVLMAGENIKMGLSTEDWWSDMLLGSIVLMVH